MDTADTFVIEDIQEKAKKENLGMHTLLVECLTSEIFRRK